MTVNCPNCTALIDVQIAAVREDDMLFRPAACGAEFDLIADGTTDLTFEPLKTTFVFDPNASE